MILGVVRRRVGFRGSMVGSGGGGGAVMLAVAAWRQSDFGLLSKRAWPFILQSGTARQPRDGHAGGSCVGVPVGVAGTLEALAVGRTRDPEFHGPCGVSRSS